MFALKIFFSVTIVAVVLAEDKPVKKPVAEVLDNNVFVRQDGYNFDFKTSDGTSRKEEGKLITVDNHQGIGIEGSYTYTGADGLQYEVSYTADDKGFKPTIRILPSQQGN